MNGFAGRLPLTQKQKVTQKWPIRDTVNKLNQILQMAHKLLRGSVTKNGPIDFASKNHFSLNSADGKVLVPKY